MGNFMLSAFLLCLAGSILRTIEPLEFQFGDLIRFKRNKDSGPAGFHYGVGLGEEDREGSELFFHKVNGGQYGAGTCVISRLKPATIAERRVDNYQDKPNYVLTDAERDAIRIRIRECLAKTPGVKNDICCGSLNLIDDNCEHTATYIRYGMDGRVSCQTKLPTAKIGKCGGFKWAF